MSRLCFMVGINCCNPCRYFMLLCRPYRYLRRPLHFVLVNLSTQTSLLNPQNAMFEASDIKYLYFFATSWLRAPLIEEHCSHNFYATFLAWNEDQRHWGNVPWLIISGLHFFQYALSSTSPELEVLQKFVFLFMEFEGLRKSSRPSTSATFLSIIWTVTVASSNHVMVKSILLAVNLQIKFLIERCEQIFLTDFNYVLW